MDDIGIMRGIPTMTVFEPVDSCQLRALFPQILALDTPVYIRLFRPNTYKIFSEKDRDFSVYIQDLSLVQSSGIFRNILFIIQ